MRKVSILSMTAGAGHNTAARAVLGAFKEFHPELDVEMIDAVNMGTGLVKQLYNDNYLWLVNKNPALWGYIYHRFDTRLSKAKEGVKKAFRKVNSKPLGDHLKKVDPDVCLCTHFYPAELALGLRAKGRIHSRIEVVLTDFHPHAFWVLDGVERYYVADDETRISLNRRGVSQDDIEVTGIPVDLKFSVSRDRELLAQGLGVDPDRFTILLSSGGMGVGPLEEIVSELLRVPGPIQLVVICGKNAKAQGSLKALPVPQEKRLVVNGFVTNMEEWMAVSDLLVSKCGGLTTAEALAAGLPLVILNPIPGQETQNSDFLLERAVAVRANDLGLLSHKVKTLMENPGHLAAMRERIRAIAKPRAAETIARLVAMNPLEFA